MCKTSTDDTTSTLFGKTIHAYTRAQAIEDGVLVAVGSTAAEAGFKWPVALTAAAWADCVAWNDADSKRQTHQDQAGRLWDVLNMASLAIRAATEVRNQLLFKLYRVPRGGRAKRPKLVTLKLMVGPGDEGEPVVTILLPNES